MEPKGKKQLEIAVIFKKRKNLKNVIIYKAVDIALGYLDDEKYQFVTRSGERYEFFTNDEYLYGFGLRKSIKELNEIYKENEIDFNDFNILRQFASDYLNDLKKYIFYFTIPYQEDYKNLELIAKDKKTNTTVKITDFDLEILKKELVKANKINFDTKKLSEEVKSEVIGQDEAIDDIITTIWQNLRSDNSKSNILLTGASGVGKTEIIRNIFKRLNLPMVIINATDLTPSAYQGTSISDYIKKLLKAADYDIAKASRGIIFIDEFDKKAETDNNYNSEIITTAIQDELLRLLEDGEYQVDISDDQFTKQYVTLNTKNITFICSGAFAKMDKIKKEQTKKEEAIGFNRNQKPNQSTIPPKITPTDLVNYGLKPEIVGRLPIIIKLNSLSKENLIAIMKNPNNQTIQEKINTLSELGIKITIEEDVYNQLAENALKNNTGARGLIGAVDSLFIKAMTEISHNQNDYSELIITTETINNPKHYTLVRKKEEKGN